MDAKYGSEVSNLKISRIIGEFSVKHCRNFIKRIFYNYYLRDLSIASIELPMGIALLLFGSLFGMYHFLDGKDVSTPAGTVMIAALPILIRSEERRVGERR